jgi:Zn-finger domain-containing protein
MRDHVAYDRANRQDRHRLRELPFRYVLLQVSLYLGSGVLGLDMTEAWGGGLVRI